MRIRGVLIFAFALALNAQERPASVREVTLALPTYDEGTPDPNPQFDAFHRDIFPNYPYTIRTAVSTIRRVTEWRVLILENEYLSCRVLPDLGGHLQGCTDRLTGKEIFYSNPAIRRSAESARNSFIATGIESSFPIAHSRVSASPVDFASSIRDGVGSVVVEDIDRTSGMQWRDEFILRPGSAVLEQRVTLHNASASRRGYHWWANAAVELDDPHLRIVYPVKWMLPHGDGPMTSWPLSTSGVDLSDVANHKTGLGLFAHASREPWMAIYKPQFRSGVAHYADPDQVKGKKIWVWGSNDTYVQSTLTEKFNSYVEMQAGEFETQPEFAFLLPQETKTFTHYWIPFRDLGGISRATRDVVLNLSRSGQATVIELNATHTLQGATLRLSEGARIVYEAQLDLNPKITYRKTLEAAPPKLTVDVIDAAAAVVLHHVEGEYDSLPFDKSARNPEPAPPSDASDSEEASLKRGEYNEQRDQWSFAWHDYEAGLTKSPGSTNLALSAGRAAFVLNRYDDAIRLLANVEKTSTEAAYYYGTALASTSDHTSEAKTALTRATSDSRYATAARLQLAQLESREDGRPGMTEAAQTVQALAAAPGTAAAIGGLEVALLRRLDRIDEAKQRLRFWLEQDPANNMLRFEQTLLGGADDAALWRHLGGDPERVLDVAEHYRQMGACDDALKLLDRRYPDVPATEREPGAVRPQDYALLVYYRGYCRMKTGGDPKPDFQAASQLSSLYNFPHREIYFRIFATALQQNDADAVAHALLGELSFDSLQPDLAIAQWTKALALKRDLPAVHRNLGRALLEIKGNAKAAAPVLLEGLRTSPGDRDITELLKRMNVPAPSGAKNNPSAEGDKEEIASRAMVRSVTDPEAAATTFSETTFPKDKQPTVVRRAYIEVQLQRQLASARSGNCAAAIAGIDAIGGVDRNVPFTLDGFDSFMKAPHFQYLLGIVESLCGDAKAAQKRWTKLRKGGDAVDSMDYAFASLAADKLGDRDAKTRIEAALQALKTASVNSSRPVLLFSQGTLLLAAGRDEEGQAFLRKALEDGDSMIEYMSLSGLAGISRK